MERLHILDGYGYIFRAHFGLATGGKDRQGVRLTTASGMPTGALYVYAQMLIRLYLDERPARIAVVFDAPGPTFRDALDPTYKANRSEMPDDLKAQMAHFRPLTEAFAWPVLAVAGVEADDVIATLTGRARARGWDVTILSGDKDLMQLVDDHVVVVDAMRQIRYDEARVREKFGVPPALVGEFLALVGDTSDNVPGLSGVGKVTAAKLLGQYGSIAGLLEHRGELKGKLKETLADPAELAKLALSQQLVTLKRDVALPAELDALVQGPWRGEELARLLGELEFAALAERLKAKGGAAAAASPVTATPTDRGADPTGLATGVPPWGTFPSPSPSTSMATAPSTSTGSEAGTGTGTSTEAGTGTSTAPVEVITDAAQVARLVAALRRAGRAALVAARDGRRADRTLLIGLAIAVPGAAPAYLPLGHRYLGAPSQLVAADLGDLAAALADPAIALVSHDAKELDHALASIGWTLGRVELDTMLAAYLLDAASDAYLLEEVVLAATGIELPATATLVGKGKSAVGFEAIAVDQTAQHLGPAAAALLATADVLATQLERAGQRGLLGEIELPIARVLARIERTGVLVDVGQLRRLSERVAGEVADLERTIYQLAGSELNLGSPKQLGALLFEQLGLRSERMRRNKTGYSTDHEVLDSLREAHPIIAPILEHRELIKLKNTYLDALPPLINPRTGRLHTSFRQAVAATGRLSSTDPNLQNIPIRTELGREIRRAFVAPPGRLLVAADYSQIELRVLAHLSHDLTLVRAFQAGIDVHSQTAAEVFGIPVAEVGAAERRVAKAVNYGLVYGQSDFGLARALDIPKSEAHHYIERYFERFATVRKFMDDLVATARQAGGATTLLGRRRPIAGLGAKDFRVRSAAERIAQNTPMQGSGADLMKLAMLAVDRELAGDDGARVLLTVHDELLLEVDEGRAPAVAAQVARVMESVYKLEVPLAVDVGIGANWADAA